MKSDTLLDLDHIWQTYQATCDCLKIAQRGVAKKDQQMLRKTTFIEMPDEEVKNWISKSRDYSDDYIILSLWAVFERIMIGYLQARWKKILDDPLSVFNKKVYDKIDFKIKEWKINDVLNISQLTIDSGKVYDKIESEIEYWRINDILDIFKGPIDSGLIEQVMQIKKYRDWIAHRNIKKGKPCNVLPQTAYDRLSRILNEIKNHPEFDSKSK